MGVEVIFENLRTMAIDRFVGVGSREGNVRRGQSNNITVGSMGRGYVLVTTLLQRTPEYPPSCETSEWMRVWDVAELVRIAEIGPERDDERKSKRKQYEQDGKRHDGSRRN